jgi:hypothetical protein
MSGVFTECFYEPVQLQKLSKIGTGVWIRDKKPKGLTEEVLWLEEADYDE